MAKISLRAYIREIDTLIDKDQIEEAVAHCKYILKFFPKHIESYRLLGKAFLKDQRHTEALDIFERVLAVIPDDFVSQIGMSIIREDENNLDAAIWHMERAFEVQPSTTTIQEELKRLFTKRDGMVPPKTRFTKGALIRMYIRGELYTQAVSETRAVLSEDPLRPDLELLLGRTYFQMGQKDKALDVCSRIVEKNPFCLEANLILTNVLLSQDKTEPAKLFQQRLQALDPYYAYVNSSAPIAAQVPDIAILVERLVWEPSVSDTEKPGWASAIGVDLEKDSDAIPDWLISEVVDPSPSIVSLVVKEPEIYTGAPANLITEPASEKPEERTEASVEEVIPDWLANAGWKESADHVEEKIETDETSEEPVQADIPDWLMEIKPQENEPLSTVEQDMIPSPISEDIKPKKPSTLQTPPLKGDTQPIKIPEKTQPAQTPSPTSEESKEDLGWFEKLSEPQDVDQSNLLYEPEQEKNIEEQFTLSQIIEENTDMGTPPMSKGADVDLIPDLELSETIPSIQETPIQDNLEQTAPVEENQNADMDSSFAWLEALAARQGADESTLLTKQEYRKDDTPDWLKSNEVPSETLSETVSPASPDDELPDWLTPGGDLHQPPIEAEQIEKSEESTLPEWLKQAVAQDIPQGEKEKPGVKEEETIPGWLSVEETSVESGQQVEAEVVQPPPLPEWLQEIQPPQPGISLNNEEYPTGKTSDETIKTVHTESDISLSPVNIVPETIQISPVEKEEKTPPLPDWLQDIHEDNPVFTDQPVSEGINLNPESEPVGTESLIEDKPLIVDPTLADETDDIGWVYESETIPVEVEASIPAMPLNLLESTNVTQESSQKATPLMDQIETNSQTNKQKEEILNYQQVKKELVKGNLKNALPQYLALINSEQSLQEIVFDLEEAIHTHPVDIDLWQTLGDAYAKANRIQDALDAYTKAEDLLD
jgi:tetratricopeptide (TPR) repeat protein